MTGEIPSQRTGEQLFEQRRQAFRRMIAEGLKATEAYLALSPEERTEAIQPEQNPNFTAATWEYIRLTHPEVSGLPD
jgi:uncharacterized membrane protein